MDWAGGGDSRIGGGGSRSAGVPRLDGVCSKELVGHWDSFVPDGRLGGIERLDVLAALKAGGLRQSFFSRNLTLPADTLLTQSLRR